MDELATFVINLDHSTERMLETARQLDNSGIEFNRLPAVIGTDLPADLGRAAIDHFGRHLLPGEMGCFQSHINAAEAFLETDAKLGLVLEDDVAVDMSAKRFLETMLARYERFSVWDIMNLGRPAKRWRTPIRRAVWDGPGYLCHAHQFPVTTTAILWSRGGARMFLAQNRQMRFPIDVQLQLWVAETGRGLACIEPPFAARPEPSLINDAPVKRRKASGQKLSGYTRKRYDRLLRTHLSAIRAQYKSGYPG